MTKSKTSTIAIVVLSVLLAAALASTIVLAAFTFSRSATTTINFAGGITLTIDGITGATADQAGAWNVTVGSETDTDGQVAPLGDKDVKLVAVSGTVTAGNAYIAYKPVVTYTGATSGSVDVAEYAKGTAYTGHDGWYILSTTQATTGAFELMDIVPLYTHGEDDADAFASREYTATIEIRAATSLDELATLVD